MRQSGLTRHKRGFRDTTYHASVPAIIAVFAQTAGAVDGNAGTEMADWLRGLIGPIFVVVVGAVGITYVGAQQIAKLFQFLLVAVVIAAVLFVPDLIQRFGGTLAGFFL